MCWFDGKIHPDRYYSINKKKDRKAIQGLFQQSSSLPDPELLNLLALSPWETPHGSFEEPMRETDALARSQRDSIRDRDAQFQNTVSAYLYSGQERQMKRVKCFPTLLSLPEWD